MAVIAMTREMATLGKDVTAGLAKRLGIEVVHHELVEHDIAERAGMRESDVHRFLEGEASLISRWRIDRNMMSRYTAQEILELAAKGNVLIRGWGAAYLLRAVPHVVSVRICAPMRFRIRVLMKRMSIADPAAAQREIERNDAAHNGTMQRMFGVDWMDSTLYSVTLNTARIPPEDCVEHIVRLCESEAFRETEQSRTDLMDQLVEVRVRAMLDRHFAANLHVVGIDARVKDRVVVLSGAISDENIIAEIMRKTHGVDGVARVESQIRYLAFARRMG